MVYLIALLLATVVSVHAGIFNNPILSDKPYHSSGAIKFNGIYYVVSSTPDDTSEAMLPIHSSTDLKNWTSAGYVFNSTTTPKWAEYIRFISPKIHRIGANFLVYFTIWNATTTNYNVHVARASRPLGPYTTTDMALLAFRDQHAQFPTIISDEGNLYLMWANSWFDINARQLNHDGLSFSSQHTVKVLPLSYIWEDREISYPWYIRRGSYHYIFYNGFCSGLGVARSTHALGPYEKLKHPISIPVNNYSCPVGATVVKDLDNQSDVIFFNAAAKESYAWKVLLAPLNWNAELWPYIGSI